MKFRIRPYHPSDLSVLVRVCLLTGANGEDASALYEDPDLLGLYFAAPYVTFEPELCFVLTINERPCGYVLGTRDNATFKSRCEREWFPTLRLRYPLPAENDRSMDAWVIRLIHAGSRISSVEESYPAHLHIDILPIGQGQGWGRALMNIFFAQLRGSGAPGLHLRVGKTNVRAVEFYKRLGLELLDETESTFLYGQRL